MRLNYEHEEGITNVYYRLLYFMFILCIFNNGFRGRDSVVVGITST